MINKTVSQKHLFNPRCWAAIAAITTTLTLSHGAGAAEEGPPGTDIYIAEINQDKHGRYQLGGAKPITTRKGYDNQPFFLPDGSGLLYTAILPTAKGQWQADSFVYHFKNQQQTNLTNSTLSEYSPTLMNDKDRFSSVVVEADSKQYLWQFPYHSDRKAKRLLATQPVGYHSWGKDDDLVMFVLGVKNTLQYKKNSSAKPRIVAENIGRSLRYVAKRNSFSFSRRDDKGIWWLSEYQPNGDKVTALVPLPEGSDYYTWLNDEVAVTAVNNTLHLWQHQGRGPGMVADWLPWVDLSPSCDTAISRLAVDRQQHKLAFVCDE